MCGVVAPPHKALQLLSGPSLKQLLGLVSCSRSRPRIDGPLLAHEHTHYCAIARSHQTRTQICSAARIPSLPRSLLRFGPSLARRAGRRQALEMRLGRTNAHRPRVKHSASAAQINIFQEKPNNARPKCPRARPSLEDVLPALSWPAAPRLKPSSGPDYCCPLITVQ